LNLHAVKRYLLLAKMSKLYLLTGKEIKPEEEEILRQIPIPEDSPPYFTPQRPYFILIPCARWETKIWPFDYWEKFLKLTEDLREEFEFYFVGGKEEKDLIHFASAMSHKYKGVFNLVGKTNLRELTYIIRRSKLVLSVDTGSMHLASLLNKPIISLFGPTSEDRTGPWSEKFLVIKEQLSCQPCFKRECKSKSCMLNIKPERVYQALKEFLTLI
ncbi:MAG: glycosyltransferase family 9 protein, partial [Thermodesulfobacteriaceae bacterium]|nr:glycosyltransferase family 9 protein [Thermodesulfobacteriaceae bacterium]